MRSRYEKHARRKERREIGNGGEKRTMGESRVDCKSNRCRRLASKQAALASPTSLLLSFPSFLSLFRASDYPSFSFSLSISLFLFLSFFSLSLFPSPFLLPLSFFLFPSSSHSSPSQLPSSRSRRDSKNV